MTRYITLGTNEAIITTHLLARRARRSNTIDRGKWDEVNKTAWEWNTADDVGDGCSHR